MGSDSFSNLHHWKNYELLIKHYSFIIYKRPRFDVTPSQDARVTILDATLLELSATVIRDNIKSGKSIHYLVHDKVREEIERNHYYR
jgi:nicotinate-nucleotide adenylyltransferase